MSVTYEVEKPEEVEVVKVVVDEVTDTAVLVDLYAELSDKLAKKLITPQIVALTKDVAKLEGKLKALAAEVDAEVEVTYFGTKYQLAFGKKANVVVHTNVEAMRDMLGEENWNKLAKVGVGDARKYLTPDEQATVFTEARNGARHMKLTER